MKIKRGCLMLVVLLVEGCGGSGYGGGGGGSPAPPTSTAFSTFVKTQLVQTSDTTEPVEVNDLQLNFDEDESAFDDVQF